MTWLNPTGNDSMRELFPPGLVDRHGEQIDLRDRNSWTYSLQEVPLREMLQVRRWREKKMLLSDVNFEKKRD